MPLPELDGDYIGVRSRLIHIDALIRKKDYPNQSTLAKLCGVSTKTIQRDLNYLQYNMDAPLDYDSSRKGYFYKKEGFFLPLVFASGTEFQAIQVIGELVSQYEGTPLGDLMHTAFERILSVFKNEDVDTLKKMTERICFAGQPIVPMDKAVWENILTAMQRDQRLELYYLKGAKGPATKRQFDAYGLIVRNRDWFLHGYCHLHKSRLMLYLPYIQKAALLDDYFDVPKDFKLAEYARTGFQGLHTEGKERHKVVLRFQPEIANVIELHRFAHDQTLKREASGHVVVTFKASALFQVMREVLSWGCNVEVLAPAELRQRVLDVAKALVKHHGG